MSKRKGRGIDHQWKFYKYKGDAAYYARCKCGFEYACYKNTKPSGFPIVPAPEKLYYYCPHCGAKKTRYCAEPVYIDDARWW